VGPGLITRCSWPVKDYGYSRISAQKPPDSGGVSNIPVRSPDGQGFVNTGSMETAPGFDTFELGIRETITGIPMAATFQNCPLGVYEVVGQHL
jgi:hypothetical protein